MGGMGGVLHDTGSFTGASCKENIQDGGERGTDDRCSCVHCPLEGLVVCCTTVPVPDSNTAGQHALNGPSVESGEDGWRETYSFQPAEKMKALLPSWRLTWCWWVQVRSSLMCTPRNLVLLTLSTVELSMVSGGWSTEFLLKSITTSFVLLTLRDRLFAQHYSASCAISSNITLV